MARFTKLLSDNSTETLEYGTQIEQQNGRCVKPTKKNTESSKQMQESFFESFGESEIWKNLLLLSMSVMLLYTPYYSMSTLQTALNKDKALGAIAQMSLNVCLMISSIFLPSLFIHYLGEKLCISIIMATYIPYMASNAFPTWATMIPTAIVIGVGSGPFWVATSTYIKKLADLYAQCTDKSSSDVYRRFFGISYMFLYASKIWGSLLASVMLEPDRKNNLTEPTPEEVYNCLSNKDPTAVNISNLKRPEDAQVYLICGVWIGIVTVGVIASCFLSPLKIKQDTKEDTKTMVIKKIKATFIHLKKSRIQQLLLPISTYYGMSLGFLSADFTKSFVGCVLGIENVGYVLMTHGIANTLAACIFGFGCLGRHVGYIRYFTFCFLAYATIEITLLLWSPTVATSWVFYVIGALWGIADAVMTVQIFAIYGYLFKTNIDAAYGIYYTCESLGMSMSFAYSAYLSTVVKQYILLVDLFLSAVLYYIVEYIDRHKENSEEI